MALKLLDYGNPNPFMGIIGSPRHLAWPVYAFRVTLPSASNHTSLLNPFEMVVLKLLDASGRLEEELISQETCIPISFVKSIVLKLRDKNLINEDNMVNQERFTSYDNEMKRDIRYCTAWVYRERVGGKVLPFLQLLDNEDIAIKEVEEGRIRTMRGDAKYNGIVPTPKDIISAINKLKKRSDIYGKDTRTPVPEQIRVMPSQEEYYLDVPIAIQKSDVEFRIADPFGLGYSLDLEDVFSRCVEQDTKLSEWMMNWRKNLTAPKVKEKENIITAPREPFDNEQCNQRYPSLIANLRTGRNRQYRTIERIYAAVEWALFYSSYYREQATAVELLRFTKESEHSAILEDAAKCLGLFVAPGGFRPLTEGMLNSFQSGSAFMETVLPISLLLAKNDDAHPLRRIAANHKDFLVRINDMKNKRGGRGHDEGGRRADAELTEDALMREVVNVLLPEVRFSDTKALRPDVDRIADARLEARTSLLGRYGFGSFNKMSVNIQERLVDVEQFWASFRDKEDAKAFVFDIYAILQALLRDKLLGNAPPSVSDTQYLSEAEDKAAKAGLGSFTDVLKKTNPFFIRETLQGKDQTLGSCVIAYLLVANEETVVGIHESHTSFIMDIEHIIDLRGHGNEPIPMAKSEMDTLRITAYKIIGTVLEM